MMGDKRQHTLIIEIIYDSREECIQLIDKLRLRSLEKTGRSQKIIGNSIMKVNLSKTKPFIEPRIEMIGENKCIVFPSSMNI